MGGSFGSFRVVLGCINMWTEREGEKEKENKYYGVFVRTHMTHCMLQRQHPVVYREAWRAK